MTVQLGREARIKLTNAVIETGYTGGTMHFGGLEFSATAARAAVVPVYGVNSKEFSGMSHSARTAAIGAAQGRASVFERLSQPETLTTKRVVDGRKISVVTANTTTLPRETVAPGRYDIEAYSSGGRLNRRQRRKRNVELRAQQLLVPVHPSNLPPHEPKINITTQNKFSNPKWIKRNSSTWELKKSFWERRPEAPAPHNTREPERLSA
ncbi:hypothetical protein MA16_Dca022494 [Dendrobium catenatum]|uniref:Uncharacterized protein n=1 Tax=Dendrobium catenatum TaxID=906689 RepID=A0A2I0XG13_9ASPA|nr:hypothetical protein MA16_Dca022494 [Dendrobium catenatum]